MATISQVAIKLIMIELVTAKQVLHRYLKWWVNYTCMWICHYIVIFVTQSTINYKSVKGIPADTKFNNTIRLLDRSKDPVGYEYVAVFCLVNQNCTLCSVVLILIC